MAITLFLIYFVTTLVLVARGVPSFVWQWVSGIYLIMATFMVGLPWLVGLILWIVIAGVVALQRVSSVREMFASAAFKHALRSIPKLSATEEEALNAGDTWLEKDIFTGTLDWKKLHAISTALTEEEQAFLDKETVTVCGMIDDWDARQKMDLPEAVWRYLKENGFLGLVIDKEYGGKGFSARAHSDIIAKLASRSISLAVSVMVPNSLGPGELLQHYGTEAQKKHYLPRLANGIDIPCFALTEPGAGSDATAVTSTAVVIEKTVNGKKVLGLMMTLEKRWITLAPIATLIGLAVNLKDPNGLLNGIGQEGITCVLISRDTPHLEIGNRHLPANEFFMNGTIRGKDVFVPIDAIIGGQVEAGHGWKMLVECLSIGRSISLPALSTALSSVAYLTTGGFARIRRQFQVEIARFEGIEEKLAEIAGLHYLMDATRLLTVAAVNEHKKPSVASAIAKYFNTELARIVTNNAMDVHGGRAVVLGPRNYLAGYYQSMPVVITVEGANIMTRNLLIFGQGSMACHPFIRKEFDAIRQNDKTTFTVLLWKHLSYFMTNFAKAVCAAWTGGLFTAVPHGSLKREYQHLTRLSYAYAWLADFALLYLGGDLKRRERISARLGDAMSYLYMAAGVLRLYKQRAQDVDDRLHAEWALSYCFSHAQHAMIACARNLPSRILGMFIKTLLFPLGQTMSHSTDKRDHALACLMTANNSYREKIRNSVYLSEDATQPIDRMEHALQLLIQHAPLYEKIRGIKRYHFDDFSDQLVEQVTLGHITEQEKAILLMVEQARWDAIQVDEFPFDTLVKR